VKLPGRIVAIGVLSGLVSSTPLAAADLSARGDLGPAEIGMTHAIIWQHGSFNHSEVIQTGLRHAFQVNQTGIGNRMLASQTEAGNRLHVSQTGDGNTVQLAQRGQDNVLDVAQHGSANQLIARQAGGNRVQATQVGSAKIFLPLFSRPAGEAWRYRRSAIGQTPA